DDLCLHCRLVLLILSHLLSVLVHESGCRLVFTYFRVLLLVETVPLGRITFPFSSLALYWCQFTFDTWVQGGFRVC
ncbi:hypothetical protein PENTCL1PPCAC_13516, partial [Pristionchus entomophagus]